MTDAPSKIAVVTGAGSGIGRAVALELLRTGWPVAPAGRHAGTLEETAALAAGAPSIVARTDVARPEDVAALFSATVERFGRLDLLFDNAGTFGPGGVPVEENFPTTPGGTWWTPTSTGRSCARRRRTGR